MLLNHNDPLVRATDASAITAALSVMIGWLPMIAVALPLIWYSMLIGEKLYQWYKVFHKKKPPQA